MSSSTHCILTSLVDSVIEALLEELYIKHQSCDFLYNLAFAWVHICGLRFHLLLNPDGPDPAMKYAYKHSVITEKLSSLELEIKVCCLKGDIILRYHATIKLIDSNCLHDARNFTLEWSILLIDNTNRSGSMEFVVPPADPSAFFHITIKITAANTFSDVKVGSVIPIRGGPPPKYALRIQLLADTYEVV